MIGLNNMANPGGMVGMALPDSSASSLADSHPLRPSAGRERSDRALGSRQLAAMLPDLAGARPAYRHVAQAIGALILDGRIALHVRLPAERELATALDASRATVTAVYDLLREQGSHAAARAAGTWTDLPEGRSPRRVTRLLGPEDTVIDLARAAPGLPGQALTDALAHIAPQLAEHAHTPGYHPYGLPELRAAIAERFTRRGLATVPEQILVTSGAQHALTLAMGLLCRARRPRHDREPVLPERPGSHAPGRAAHRAGPRDRHRLGHRGHRIDPAAGRSPTRLPDPRLPQPDRLPHAPAAARPPAARRAELRHLAGRRRDAGRPGTRRPPPGAPRLPRHTRWS
ncbi:hypothetical protein GCM10020000_07840 [Streptomyces olivoverticillatus]